MHKNVPRTLRLGDQIQRELAQLIRDELSDPRVGWVTVSEVSVSRDLAHAKVYVTLLGCSEEQAMPAVDALNHAAGYLRRLLGRRLTSRQVPALHFLFDSSFDKGARLSKLIDSAVADDNES